MMLFTLYHICITIPFPRNFYSNCYLPKIYYFTQNKTEYFINLESIDTTYSLLVQFFSYFNRQSHVNKQ